MQNTHKNNTTFPRAMTSLVRDQSLVMNGDMRSNFFPFTQLSMNILEENLGNNIPFSPNSVQGSSLGNESQQACRIGTCIHRNMHTTWTKIQQHQPRIAPLFFKMLKNLTLSNIKLKATLGEISEFSISLKPISLHPFGTFPFPRILFLNTTYTGAPSSELICFLTCKNHSYFEVFSKNSKTFSF